MWLTSPNPACAGGRSSTGDRRRRFRGRQPKGFAANASFPAFIRGTDTTGPAISTWLAAARSKPVARRNKIVRLIQSVRIPANYG
jgi:hypothetical protein